MNTTGMNEAEINALGGRIVRGDEIPAEILAIADELGININNMRVIDMSGTALNNLEDDARFLGEVREGVAEFDPNATRMIRGIQDGLPVQFYVCLDPNCKVCQDAIDSLDSIVTDEDTAAAEAEAGSEEANPQDFFKTLLERLQARSLNQEEAPVPQQDEAESEFVGTLGGEAMMGNSEFDEEAVEALVGGQIALQQSVNCIFDVLKRLLTKEELAEVDHLTGLDLAQEQAAQIRRSEIIGRAKGFVSGRYGMEFEDLDFDQQRQVLELCEKYT